MKKHHLYLQNKKDKVEQEELLPLEVYRFYVDFFKAQFDIYDKLQQKIKNFFVSKTDPPLIDHTKFSFVDEAHDVMKEGLEKCAQIIALHNSGLDFSFLLKAAHSEPHFMVNFAMKLLAQNREDFEVLSQEFRIDADEMIFLAVNWLKPYMVLFAEKNQNTVAHESWDKSRCPICGYFADMAIIRESHEGKRFLHCALCENEWQFKRLACTICGEENAHKLGYFEIEGNSTYRVDYCDSCRGYIKTMRISKGFNEDDFDISVENILTVGFDAQLIERGYLRP